MNEFLKRVAIKMVVLFLGINILYALLIPNKISSVYQIIELRFWGEKFITIVAYVYFFMKTVIEKN